VWATPSELDSRRKREMSENSSSATTKISTYLMSIVLLVLALSIVALILAVNFYPSDVSMALYLLVIGLIAMGLSVYILLQSRKRVASMKIKAPKVMTTVECRKCGIKNVREFQRGDFIFKDLEACQKCNDNMIITAIYKEVKEKEKTYNV
jgi:ABC-type multidrug transport system fused ATPase/permease subunit